MVKSCSRQSFRPSYFCGSVSCGTPTLAVDGWERALFSTPVFPFTGASGTPALDEYQRIRQTYAADITASPDFSIGYVSANLVERAAVVSAGATGDITSAGLIQALYTLRNETLGGLSVPLNFSESGASNGNCSYVLVGDGTGSGLTLPSGPGAICRSVRRLEQSSEGDPGLVRAMSVIRCLSPDRSTAEPLGRLDPTGP